MRAPTLLDCGEQTAEPFAHCGVREDRVAERGVGQPGGHGDLHGGEEFAGVGAEGGEAEDLVALPLWFDERFHEAARFGKGARPQHRDHREFREAVSDAAFAGFAFAEADAGEFGVGEEAERDLSAGGDAVAAGEVVAEDAEVVERDMREVGTAGAIADGVDVLGRCVQTLVDADVAMSTGCVLGGRPNSAPRRKSDATLALWMTFLLGRQAMFGHEPPI